VTELASIDRTVSAAVRATARHAMRHPPMTPQQAYRQECTASVVAGLAGLQKAARTEYGERLRCQREWADLIAAALAECMKRDER